MVSRILISIALLCSSLAFSQDENGLTFSQVLIVDITNEVKVPEGKVWKVVSTLSVTTGYTYGAIYLNNLYTILFEGPQSNLPLWLPSGTTII